MYAGYYYVVPNPEQGLEPLCRTDYMRSSKGFESSFASKESAPELANMATGRALHLEEAAALLTGLGADVAQTPVSA